MNDHKEGKIALCYIRLSLTRDDNDKNSVDRQKSNIEAICQQKGWIPEWYEDADGHKSGRSEKGRHAWLSLKKRFGDPDVVALVANDLSRLHRKGWRVGDLIETLDRHDIALTLAAPGKQDIDTSTQQGRLLVQFGAMLDEYYAEDVAQRARDSVLYRKAQGITIGRPPFGTVRDENGLLIPSDEGAWLLSDGTFIAGKENEQPEDGAIWRGYYDAAKAILERYSKGGIGAEKLAYEMNEEGWAFRTRKGKPRRINRDDVRRVVATWPEYGGLVTDGKAIARPGYEQEDIDEIAFDEERAVFPIELLRSVARVREKRTFKPSNNGIKRKTHPYPLATITYCAHCEALARKHNDPSLRSTFGGANANDVLRYHHKRGIKCGVQNRSVRCESYEEDFYRLLKLFTIKPEAIELMTELAIESEVKSSKFKNEADVEKQRQKSIALSRRKIEAAKYLFLQGEISQQEYEQHKQQNEREIGHWQAYTTERQQMALELTMCVETVDRIASLWDYSSDEDRRGLVHNLFEYVVYNLDQRRIVDFRLKPWAERFMVLRAKLYQDEHGIVEEVFIDADEDQGSVVSYAPYGVRTRVSALRGRRPRPLDEWS